ncbi:hypothetical protein CC117_18740 [Parafrankia colletiae]|uniref:Uncharacterized protein n=1 Tax=Parafrankia colletiae TaxID=573497 RepID=A0A1S1QNC2_9ACTN|nr:hypothetical protein CC117_18740 [Parafrankia colletiae]
MDTVPPSDYKWLLGFATANLVLHALTAVLRRHFGDEVAATYETCVRTVVLGAFTVWLAVFWGFTYAAVFVGLGAAGTAVERYRRQRAHSAAPEIADKPAERRT